MVPAQSSLTRRSEPPVKSPRQPVQHPARALEFRKAVFLGTKFPRMRDHAAARPSSRVLDVQHLMKQNVFHGAGRNAGTIHAAIEKNLIRPRVVTAKLSPPGPGAPSDMRALQLSREVFSIKLIVKPVQLQLLSV